VFITIEGSLLEEEELKHVLDLFVYLLSKEHHTIKRGVEDEVKNVNSIKLQVRSKHQNRELLPDIVWSHQTLSDIGGLCPA
jgi:hypothetical protein